MEFNELNIIKIALVILTILVIYLLFTKSSENFADSSIDTIRDEINKQYNMDIEAMRNLGAISKSLLTGTNYHSTSVGTPGTLTIPADNTILSGNSQINGNSNINGNLTVKGVNITDQLDNIRNAILSLRFNVGDLQGQLTYTASRIK